MDGKRIGSIGLTIVFVVLIFWWRSSERSDDSKEVKAVAMAMVDSIDVNNTDKAVLKTMAEYALILGGIAIIVILAIVFLGGRIRDLFESTGSSVNTPVS